MNVQDTVYAKFFITAKAYESEGEYEKALFFYGHALKQALYGAMLPITSSQARAAQEARHRCYRKLGRVRRAS